MDNQPIRDPEEELRNAVEAALAGLHVALPVRVVKDSDGKTVAIQPTVKATQLMPDGTTKLIDYPMLDALVHHAGGGGTTFTVPIKDGDEGLAIFASRSIHNWREQGGTQPQVDSRRHDLSDAMFIPGIRSKPRDLKDINTEAAETRSDDGKHRMTLHPKNGITASVDDGKHTMSLSPETGIAMKTAMALAVDAAKGSSFKGAAHFADKVTSDKSIGAPSLSGALTGMLGGVVGFFLALAAVGVLTGFPGHPSDVLTASFRAAAWVP